MNGRRRTGRTLSAWLVAACFTVPLAQVSAAGEAEPRTDAAPPALIEALSASVRGERPIPRVIEDLARLDPVPVADLFDACHLGWVPLPDRADDLDRRLVLGPREVGALRAALIRADRTAVRAFLDDLSRREQDVERRRSALTVLGDIGTVRDARLLVALATMPEGPGRNPRTLRDGFGQSLSAIVLREPGPLGILVDVFEAAPSGLRHPIARSLAQTRSEIGLGTLTDLLRKAPGLDALVLHEIAGMLAGNDIEADEFTLLRVRSMLGAREPSVVQAAARAVAALRDEEALADLIGLLWSDDENVRGAARRALHEVTGLSLGTGPRAWEAWYAKEQGSRARRLTGLAGELESEDPRAVAAALNELARLRTGRAEVAALIVPCLRSSRPDIVRVACAALAQLRQPSVMPDLVACLDHGDGGVRDAAWSALKRISGLDLPPQRAAWTAALERERKRS